MTTYRVNLYGDDYRIKANFAEASDTVLTEDEDGNWACLNAGQQVANFSHSPKQAMRYLLQDVTDDPQGEDIDDAIENMITEDAQ